MLKTSETIVDPAVTCETARKTCEQHSPYTSRVSDSVGRLLQVWDQDPGRPSSPWPRHLDYWLAASQASIQSLYTSTGSERSEKWMKDKRKPLVLLCVIITPSAWRQGTSIRGIIVNDCKKSILSIVLTASSHLLVSIALINNLSGARVKLFKLNVWIFEYEALVKWSYVVGTDKHFRMYLSKDGVRNKETHDQVSENGLFHDLVIQRIKIINLEVVFLCQISYFQNYCPIPGNLN